jgi:hypothetical protein
MFIARLLSSTRKRLQDESLTKARVRYLESRMIQVIAQANRAVLDNDMAPPAPPLHLSRTTRSGQFPDHPLASAAWIGQPGGFAARHARGTAMILTLASCVALFAPAGGYGEVIDSVAGPRVARFGLIDAPTHGS